LIHIAFSPLRWSREPTPVPFAFKNEERILGFLYSMSMLSLFCIAEECGGTLRLIISKNKLELCWRYSLLLEGICCPAVWLINPDLPTPSMS
jgi:hypothetical protein